MIEEGRNAEEARYRALLELDVSAAGARETLVAGLHDESWRVRRAAAEGLTRVPERDQVVERLISVLGERDETGARNAAAESLSGMGLPFALTLMKPHLDVWEPGEHNGTFRGFAPAFVTATAALETFWRDDAFTAGVDRDAAWLDAELADIAASHAELGVATRGRGLARGMVFEDPAHAGQVCKEAFANGLLMETSGAEDEVVKFLPPLTTSRADFEEGVAIVREAVAMVSKKAKGAA